MLTTSRECIVIGPTKAGKTVLIGTLRHAATLSQRQDPGISGSDSIAERAVLQAIRFITDQGFLPEVKIRSTNQNLSTLWGVFYKRMKETGSVELPGSTSAISNYEFEIGVGHAAQQFSCMDGPGGAIFKGSSLDENMEKLRRELLNKLKNARGLMVCVDLADRVGVTNLISGLIESLPEFADGRAPFERVVFVATKADMLFENLDITGEERALDTDPASFINDEIVDAVIPLRDVLRRGCRVAYTFSSVYGFDADGKPNFDKDLNRINTFEPQSSWLKTWQPFQVLEPFLYLTDGVRRGNMAVEAIE